MKNMWLIIAINLYIIDLKSKSTYVDMPPEYFVDTLTIEQLVKKYKLTRLPDSVAVNMLLNRNLLHFKTPEEAEIFLKKVKLYFKENIKIEIKVDSTNISQKTYH